MAQSTHRCTVPVCKCEAYEFSGTFQPGFREGKGICVCGHVDREHNHREPVKRPSTRQPESQEYRGTNGTLVLTPTAVVIKRGLRGAFFTGHLRGDKEIPYASIAAVQLKKTGFAAGYLQLTIHGGPEAKGGLDEARKDENTVLFGSGNAQFERAKELILERMAKARGDVPITETKVCPDCAETIKAAAKVCRYCGHRFT